MKKHKIKVIRDESIRQIELEYHKTDKARMLDMLSRKYESYTTISMGVIPKSSPLYDGTRKGMCRISIEVY